MSNDFDNAVAKLTPPLKATFDKFSSSDHEKFRTEIAPNLLALYLRLFSLNWSSPESFSENVAAATEAIASETVQGGPNDPAIDSSSRPWLWLLHQMRQNAGTAAALVRRWYRHLIKHDRERGTLSRNRGIAAYIAASSELGRNNAAVARRWLHISVVEDARENHKGVARTVLLENMGETPAALDELAALVRSEKGTQADFRAHAEYLLTRWYLSRDLRQSDFSLDSEHLPDPWLLKQLVDSLPLPRTTTKAQGDALETLAAHLLSHIVGCFPVRRSETLDFENDLVIRNLSRHVSPALDILGRYFLVECKNWTNTVGTRELPILLAVSGTAVPSSAYCLLEMASAATQTTARVRTVNSWSTVHIIRMASW